MGRAALPEVTPSSTVVASPDLACGELGGEVVILDMSAGAYFGLNAVGARVWSLIREPSTLSAVRDAIVHEYDVEPARCERDLLALVRDLLAQKLVTLVATEPAGASPGPSPASRETHDAVTV